MGQHRWLNVAPAIIVGVLLMLSFILVIATLFPHINASKVALGAGIVLAVGLVVVGLFSTRNRRAAVTAPAATQDPQTWRMPPLAELTTPAWSTARKVGMLTLRGYLAIATVLLVVKVIQLIQGGR